MTCRMDNRRARHSLKEVTENSRPLPQGFSFHRQTVLSIRGNWTKFNPTKPSRVSHAMD